MITREKLKFIRVLHGVKQVDIARKLHVSKNYICMIENNKHYCSNEEMSAILNAIYSISQDRDKSKVAQEVAEFEINKNKKGDK